ncbi:hypothetical protein [Estrella lausannensis]|uniref:Putative iron transporter n=1 Tax=Estrella lausannensis TaxID=483423 RepID=A0A0H5DPU8_9BACT|nr:hypothetical protein [Estrella lausannensis]CRX38053.1 Putative iron transporter [Estrella lausannensis]
MNNTPGCFTAFFTALQSCMPACFKCCDSDWNGRDVRLLDSDDESSESIEIFESHGTNYYSALENSPQISPRSLTWLESKDSPKITLVSAHALSDVASTSSRIARTEEVVAKRDNDYGDVRISPFNPTWLSDYPQVAEHLHTEHLLHVKGLDAEGEGLTWHTAKFSTDMNPVFNPESVVNGSEHGGFQMKMGYFIIPKEKMSLIQAPCLSGDACKEVNADEGYRFFVHPEAYDHFRSLHQEEGIRYVSAEDSEYVATPTSSYRSLAIRRVEVGKNGELLPAKDSIPFIVKVGVGGEVLGSDRWLSISEVERSVQSQMAFDGMEKRKFDGSLRWASEASELVIFPESLGMALTGLECYPPKGTDSQAVKASGVIIREFPKELLEGKCRIVSMAALMSAEKLKPENALVTQMAQDRNEYSQLPLIYQVMEATINAGKATSSADFVEKFLIKGYIDAIEAVTFQEGMTLEPHSQNLCMVLNPDLTPRGFAYRDHGGIWIDAATRGLQGKRMKPFHRKNGDGNAIFKSKGAISKGYIGSFSWFYRYQVFVKMLNVLTKLKKEDGGIMPPFAGAPYQIGSLEKLKERSINTFFKNNLKADRVNQKALAILKEMSITKEDSQQLLRTLDRYYFEKMASYFDMGKVAVDLEEGALPASEGGSGFEGEMLRHNGFLGSYKFYNIPSDAFKAPLEKMPELTRRTLFATAITSFEKTAIETIDVKSFMLLKKGVCFFDERGKIVAFSPYATSEQKRWIERTITENS